ATASTTPIQATLDTGVPGTYHIEAYNAFACDPSGNGEGQEFVGSGDISFTNPNQAFTLTLGAALPVGSVVTMTATAPDGSTSEFSNCATVSGPAGLLQGSLSASANPPASQAINLSTVGTADWAVWGYAVGGTSTSLAPDVRKAGGTAISNLTNIDPAPSVNLRGIGQFA